MRSSNRPVVRATIESRCVGQCKRSCVPRGITRTCLRPLWTAPPPVGESNQRSMSTRLPRPMWAPPCEYLLTADQGHDRETVYQDAAEPQRARGQGGRAPGAGGPLESGLAASESDARPGPPCDLSLRTVLSRALAHLPAQAARAVEAQRCCVAGQGEADASRVEP